MRVAKPWPKLSRKVILTIWMIKILAGHSPEQPTFTYSAWPGKWTRCSPEVTFHFHDSVMLRNCRSPYSLLNHPHLGLLQGRNSLILELMFSLHRHSSMMQMIQHHCFHEGFEVGICALNIRSPFHWGVFWNPRWLYIKREQIVEILAPDRSVAKFPATWMDLRIHQSQGTCDSNASMLCLNLVNNFLEYFSLTNKLWRASN